MVDCDSCKDFNDVDFKTALELLNKFSAVHNTFKNQDVSLKWIINKHGVMGLVAIAVNEDDVLDYDDEVNTDLKFKELKKDNIKLNSYTDYFG